MQYLYATLNFLRAFQLLSLPVIIRAMVETGAIQNKNIVELARFIPYMFRVKQKGTFSPGELPT
jgi:hypothetical protein